MDRSRKDLQVSGSSTESAKGIDNFIARLCAAYPRAVLSVSTIALYYERLKRFSDDQLKRAADIIVDNCDYLPPISEIIRTIQNLPRPRPKLLDMPPPPAEEVQAAREQIQKMIDDLALAKNAKDDKRSEEERRVELQRQAAILKGQP